MFTGGPSARDVEAEVMANYARSLGVPESAILIESRARDTVDNARLSVALLCQDRARDPCRPDVIVVSTPYHLRRATRLFECAGARTQAAAAELPDTGTQIGFSAHEYAVRVAYVFVDACARARVDQRSR